MGTFMYLQNQTPTVTNEGRTPYELFYKMKPDVEHIHAFRCVVKVVLPSQMLGKLDNQAMMGYLLGYKYKGGYWVWIPKLGVQETRDVVFYEGKAPMMPVDGGTISPGRSPSDKQMPTNFGAASASTCHLIHSLTRHRVEHEKDDMPDALDIEYQDAIILVHHNHSSIQSPYRHKVTLRSLQPAYVAMRMTMRPSTSATSTNFQLGQLAQALCATQGDPVSYLPLGHLRG